MLLWQLLGFRDIQNKGVGKQEKARELHIINLSSEVSIFGRHHLSLVHFDRSCSIFSVVVCINTRFAKSEAFLARLREDVAKKTKRVTRPFEIWRQGSIRHPCI